MNEDYLWSRDGEPDLEIAQLEQVLRPLRYEPDQSRLELPITERARPTRSFGRWAACIAVAAIVLMAVSLLNLHLRGGGPAADTIWKVSWNDSKPLPVRTGEVLETGRSSAARLESDFVGEVRVGPDSRLRVLRSTKSGQRLALEQGTIHALIWAPPTQFVVDTPSAKTIDLGCQYTLRVSSDGTGLLNVETGWVAFQWHNLESFIPGGAACSTLPGRGPGIPYFLDAPLRLREGIAHFDRTGEFQPVREFLSSARPQDGLTLWHLLSRTDGEQRAEVFDRFSALVRLPSSVTKARVLEGNPDAMDAAWNALNLGNTDWWREWKRKW